MVRRFCWLGILLVISNLISFGAGRAIETALASPPASGLVWAWGNDNGGQLGDGTAENPVVNPTPGQVVGPTSGTFLSDVVAVAGGSAFSLALKRDGTVWAWGYDDAGRLGDGTMETPTIRATPSQVVAPGGGFLTDVIAIAGGSRHSLALKSDGTVWAWGEDGSGQLGDGIPSGTTFSAIPSQVVAPGGGFLSNISAIAGGAYHNLALKSDGTVWGWGIAEGESSAGATPSQVVPLTDVSAIADGYNRSLAVKHDGTVWGWGTAEGVGSEGPTPIQVVPLADASAIAAGYDHFLAVTSPAPLLTVAPVTAAAGSTVTLTATLTNRGAGLGGQTIAFSLRGTPVGTATTNAGGVATLSASLGNIPVGTYPTGIGAAFAGDEDHPASSGTAKLTVTMVPGPVWAWGSDDEGALGDGTVGNPTIRPTPGQVVGPTNGTFLADVIAVASGTSHSLALKRDGTVWAWGDDTSGQLGDGTLGSPPNRGTPGQVASLINVVAIAAGGDHSLALKSDGTVWAWGYDSLGQLGDGTVGDGAGGSGSRATPSQVVAPGGGFLTDVSAIAGGIAHNLALKRDGTVWAWGQNGKGELGNGTVQSPSVAPPRSRSWHPVAASWRRSLLLLPGATTAWH
ncbi:MAG: RCC1 repeat-containing protein [Chloroflexia bacterium]